MEERNSARAGMVDPPPPLVCPLPFLYIRKTFLMRLLYSF